MYRKVNIELSPSLKIKLKLSFGFRNYSPTTIVYWQVQDLICTKTLYLQCGNLNLISSKCSRFFFLFFCFLLYKIFVMFGGCGFQYTLRNFMVANCAPLLADLFLFSYDADLMHGLLKKTKKKLVTSFTH